MAASKRLSYIYVQNWKCGSSTVRTTLWAAEHAMGLAALPSHPHMASPDSPFSLDPARWERVEEQFVFTIVRNPYVRLLSAYLDKIWRRGDKNVRDRFVAQYGLGAEDVPFIDFLRLVASTPESRMDPHWRPQSFNLAPSIVPYDFIGSLENFEEDLRYILRRIFPERDLPIRDFKFHQTGSVDRLTEYFGPEELRLTQAIYARDFAELGYDRDITKIGPPNPPAKPASNVIKAWGRAMRLLENRDHAGAEREFRALRPCIGGLVFEEQLLRSRCKLPRPDRSAIEESIAALERELALGHDQWSVWSWYGRGLLRVRRWEDGIRASLIALQRHRTAGPQRRRRRSLLWRLALLRASKGDLDGALTIVAVRPRRPDAAKHPRLRAARVRLRQAFLVATAVAANLTGAASWHPDRSMGIVGRPELAEPEGLAVPVKT
ncbi:MAG: sulfotransferase family protein [Geminicoccaceae bacterium]